MRSMMRRSRLHKHANHDPREAADFQRPDDDIALSASVIKADTKHATQDAIANANVADVRSVVDTDLVVVRPHSPKSAEADRTHAAFMPRAAPLIRA